MALPTTSSKLPVFDVRPSVSGKIDAEVVAVFQDAAKKAVAPQGGHGALVERLKKSDAFSARTGAIQFVRYGGKGSVENVAFLGLGSPGELTEERLRSAGGMLWGKLSAEKTRTAVVDADALAGARGLKADLTSALLLRALAEGLMLSAYQFV